MFIFTQSRSQLLSQAGVAFMLTIPPAVSQASDAQSQLAPPRQAAGYRLVFQDEFDHLDLSPDGTGNHSWYPNVWFNHFRKPVENMTASGSVLSLIWRNGQGSYETSIETASPDGKYAHSWRYGYFEVRMRWDVIPGAWPGIWMIPEEAPRRTDFYDGREDAGELDIFEGQGDHPSMFYGTMHRWNDLKELQSSNGRNSFWLPLGTDMSQYHTYGLLWEKGRMTWFFDDRPLHSETPYPIFDKQSYFLALTMQEGANWKQGDMTGVRANSMKMDVDWVRVWQKP